MVNRLITLVLFIIIFFTASFVKYSDSKEEIVWGINGHPLTQQDYSFNTWDDQVNFIKDLKLDSYRFDVLLNTEGYAKNDKSFIGLLNKLKTNGISAFPVLMQSGFKTKDTTEIYKLSYLQGRNFASRYKQYLSYIEVGNEEDNNLILSPDVDGTREAHYDLRKTGRIMAELKGFIDGVKSIKATVKVSVSVNWVHFYFLELLKKHEINYDIIGYHWYSSMGDITRVRAPYGNVLNQINLKYKKPVWITEFNYFKGTTTADYEKQDKYIVNSLNNILNNGQIERFYIYELFDQPALKLRYPGEAAYGLLAKDRLGTDYIKKDSYLSYQKIVNSYKGNNK